MNQFSVIGNVTKKPELRVSAKGKSYIHVSLAVNRPYSDSTDFFVFSAFAETAVKLKKLNKGDRIYVQSYAKNCQYEKDGQKIYGTDYIITYFELVRKKR